jgi:hypothetical protein
VQQHSHEMNLIFSPASTSQCHGSTITIVAVINARRWRALSRASDGGSNKTVKHNQMRLCILIMLVDSWYSDRRQITTEWGSVTPIADLRHGSLETPTSLLSANLVPTPLIPVHVFQTSGTSLGEGTSTSDLFITTTDRLSSAK